MMTMKIDSSAFLDRTWVVQARTRPVTVITLAGYLT